MTIHQPPHEADVGTRRPHDRPGRPYAVPVPQTALLDGALPRIDWSDAFARGRPGRHPDRPSGLGRRDLPQRAGVGARAARSSSGDRQSRRDRPGPTRHFRHPQPHRRRDPARHRRASPELPRLGPQPDRSGRAEHRRPDSTTVAAGPTSRSFAFSIRSSSAPSCAGPLDRLSSQPPRSALMSHIVPPVDPRPRRVAARCSSPEPPGCSATRLRPPCTDPGHG